MTRLKICGLMEPATAVAVAACSENRPASWLFETGDVSLVVDDVVETHVDSIALW